MLKSGVLAAALLAVFAQNALADRIRISGHTDYRDGSGGEFNVRAYDQGGHTLLNEALATSYTTVNGTTVGSANGTRMNPGFDDLVGFQTFCLEFNEFISLNGIYDAAITDGSIYGGVAGGVDPDNGGPLPKTDPISIGTAYLYTLFATGTLSDYDYENGDDRADSAEMLQHALWYLEDEISLTKKEKKKNIFLTGSSGAITLFGDGTGVGVGGAKANNNGVYNVRVLNLWGSSPSQKQDQLIMVAPAVIEPVPDGAVTAILLGLAFSGLALLRRKSD